MKKITLLLAMLAFVSMNAQIFSDDFEDSDISDWTQIDEDGDGNTFFAYDGGTGILTMSSRSWDGVPLTPDNYTVSPAIDVTGLGTIMLDYQAGGQDPLYSQEVYTVYVSTGNTVADFMNADPTVTVSFSEDLGDDPAAAGALVDRSLDASSLDGATTVYIAFRHHDVTDQFIINFNNVVLDAVLGVDDNTLEGFIQFVDQNNVLQLSSTNAKINAVSIYSIAGQKVITNTFASTTATIDLSSLSTGVYLVKVSVAERTTTFRITKK